MNSRIKKEVTFRANTKNFDFTFFFNLIGEFFLEHNIEKNEYSKLKLALEELIINVSSYAYDDDGEIIIKIKIRPALLSALIVDKGMPFDPTKYSGEINNSLESIQNLESIGGRGIYLIKKFMNKFIYKRTAVSNIALISI